MLGAWIKPIVYHGEPYGPQLRQYRELLDMTQTELSGRTGISNSNLCHFEKGDNTRGSGSMTTAIEYAKGLGCKSMEVCFDR